MNRPVDSLMTAAVPGDTAPLRATLHVRAASRFYVGMVAALLLTVLLGFAPGFYLRHFGDAKDLPPHVWIHGAILTGWFAVLGTQAMLVAKRRVSLHRQLGWLAAATGVAAVATSLQVTLAAVAAETLMARTAWSNLANALAFTVLLGAALLLRRDAETHKRLILLASIAFVQPAVARWFRWPPFSELGVAPVVGAAVGSLLFVIAIAVHDLAVRRKLHTATLLGGAFLIALRLTAVFVVSASDWGRAVLRALV